MTPNTNPTDRVFPVAKKSETPGDEIQQFGEPATSADLKEVKGGFGDVKGDVCVNAPGATGNTHIEKK